MDTPIIIRNLSDQRLKEARVLVRNKMFDGAHYLAGYSVEFALKAKICERFGVPNLFKFEETDAAKKAGKSQEKSDEQKAQEEAIDIIKRQVKTHNLFTLLFYSCLREKFDEAKAENINFMNLFSLVFNGWKAEDRYKPCGHFKDSDVKKMITLLPELLEWIAKN